MEISESIFKKIEAESFKRDFYKFVLKAFELLHNGAKPVTNWHIKYMCDVAQEKVERVVKRLPRDKHVLCNIPPRSLKSFVWSVCLPAYTWTLDPSLHITNVSYAGSLSIQHNGDTRRIIESEWYQELFPYVRMAKGENKKSEFMNTAGGRRYSTSTFGTFTGKGANIIIVDDMMNPDISDSEVKRPKAIDTFNKTVSSRFNEPEIGLFCVIEQRLHRGDLSGEILGKEADNYLHISFPATNEGNIQPPEFAKRYKSVKNSTIKYLMPKRFTPTFLASQKIKMGSYGYAGQYGQAPAPPEGGILKEKWFRKIEPSKFIDITRDLVFDLFVDGAQTEDDKNDATAVMIATTLDNIVYVWKVFEFRLEEPEALKEIQRIHDQYCSYRQSYTYIEPKASGKGFVQNLRRHTDIIAVEDETLKAMHGVSKVGRVRKVTPDIEAGRVVLCDDNWTDSFLEQVKDFPNGTHDDMIDTLVMACRQYLTYKFEVFSDL